MAAARLVNWAPAGGPMHLVRLVSPLCFLVDLTGRRYAASMDDTEFFYGFLSVAMAWHIA